MTYLSVATMSGVNSLGRRVIACAALEGIDQPESWVAKKKWALAATVGWETAWDAGKLRYVGQNDEAVGAKEDVITDAMILVAVQTVRT